MIVIKDAIEPVEGVDLNDCVFHTHPEYGNGYFFTPDAIQEFYTPYQFFGAQPEPKDE